MLIYADTLPTVWAAGKQPIFSFLFGHSCQYNCNKTPFSLSAATEQIFKKYLINCLMQEESEGGLSWQACEQ